jgi:hypothetical protein
MKNLNKIISSGIKIEYSYSFKTIIKFKKKEETKVLILFQLDYSLILTILT